jgi:hypothetical protein
MLPPDHALRLIGLPALVGARCQVNNSSGGTAGALPVAPLLEGRPRSLLLTWIIRSPLTPYQPDPETGRTRTWLELL